MPIDYRQRVMDEEQALEDLLARRRTGVDQTRAEIEGARLQAFGPVLQSKFGGLGLSPSVAAAGAAQGAAQQGALGNRLDEILSNRKYQAGRERINLAYNRALDRALSAGRSSQEAEVFARQFMQDEIARQNEASMNAQGRAQKIRQQDIANKANLRGEALDAQYQDNGQGEYQAAMYRILTGLPTQLLSYYMLDKSFGQPEQFKEFSGGLRGLTFSTGINPMTGRRTYG